MSLEDQIKELEEKNAQLEIQLNDLVSARVTSGEISRCIMHCNQIVEQMRQAGPTRQGVEELCATIAHAANRLRGHDG
jgi:hypothetical protein